MAGRTLGPAQELQLTPERRMAEAMSASLVRPWLEAMVRELAASYGIPWPDSLAKALRSPSLDELRATFQANARRSGEQRKLLEQEVALQADEMGEARLLKVLERAAKLGRSEAARAFLGEDNLREVLGRKLSPASVERLRTTARRNVRLIRATTERALADIASRPSPDNLDALLARLYSTHRAGLVGLNTTALGYSEGVASVLKEMRVGHVYVRTMADDRVCPKCHAVESNPELARMTVRQFLARYPLHPKCRCYPSISPYGETVARYTRSLARVVEDEAPDGSPDGSMSPMEDLAKALNPQQTQALRAEIAKRRMRVGGKFAAGKVTPDDVRKPGGKKPAPSGESRGRAMLKEALGRASGQPAPAAKAEPKAKASAGKAKSPAPKGGDRQVVKQGAEKKPLQPGPKAPPAAPSAPPGERVDDPTAITNPGHLTKAAGEVLAQLRALKPGSPEHKHALVQYNALRASIKAFNANKGQSATPSTQVLDGGSVKMPKAPAWYPHGKENLTTPRQFEMAAMHAQTRAEGLELANYMERYMHTHGAGGEDWATAWKDLKDTIKSMPHEPRAGATSSKEAPDGDRGGSGAQGPAAGKPEDQAQGPGRGEAPSARPDAKRKPGGGAGVAAPEGEPEPQAPLKPKPPKPAKPKAKEGEQPAGGSSAQPEPQAKAPDAKPSGKPKARKPAPAQQPALADDRQHKEAKRKVRRKTKLHPEAAQAAEEALDRAKAEGHPDGQALKAEAVADDARGRHHQAEGKRQAGGILDAFKAKYHEAKAKSSGALDGVIADAKQVAAEQGQENLRAR